MQQFRRGFGHRRGVFVIVLRSPGWILLIRKWVSHVPLEMHSCLPSPTVFLYCLWQAHVKMRPLPEPTAWTTEPGNLGQHFPVRKAWRMGCTLNPSDERKQPLLQWWMPGNRTLTLEVIFYRALFLPWRQPSMLFNGRQGEEPSSWDGSRVPGRGLWAPGGRKTQSVHIFCHCLQPLRTCFFLSFFFSSVKTHQDEDFLWYLSSDTQLYSRGCDDVILLKDVGKRKINTKTRAAMTKSCRERTAFCLQLHAIEMDTCT